MKFVNSRTVARGKLHELPRSVPCRLELGLAMCSMILSRCVVVFAIE